MVSMPLLDRVPAGAMERMITRIEASDSADFRARSYKTHCSIRKHMGHTQGTNEGYSTSDAQLQLHMPPTSTNLQQQLLVLCSLHFVLHHETRSYWMHISSVQDMSSCTTGGAAV